MLEILYEDDSVIAVNKPAGLPSVARNSDEDFPDSEEHAEGRIRRLHPEARAVHRLDTDTSGVLLFAKTEAEANRLRALWTSSEVTKIYRALVVLPPTVRLPDVLDFPIGHAARSAKRMVAITPEQQAWRLSTLIRGSSRPARTEILSAEPVSAWGGTDPVVTGTVFDVTLKILTGLRHQIRVHLKAAGASLIGDPLYSKAPGSRLYLHASRLEWPGLKGPCRVEAPLPENWHVMSS